MRWTVRTTAAAVLAICGACVLIGWMLWPKDSAEPARNILAGEPTQPPMQIDVVTFRQEVKQKLRLPLPVQDNPQQHVVAATRIEVEEDRPVEVTAVIDQATGRTELYERELERPWLQRSNRTTLGVYLGINDRQEQTVRVEARHEFLRVKALRVGAIGTADMTVAGTSGFIGLGVWGGW